jgi:hypothetical protein
MGTSFLEDNMKRVFALFFLIGFFLLLLGEDFSNWCIDPEYKVLNYNRCFLAMKSGGQEYLLDHMEAAKHLKFDSLEFERYSPDMKYKLQFHVGEPVMELVDSTVGKIWEKPMFIRYPEYAQEQL